jgi:hypothetical protein
MATVVSLQEDLTYNYNLAKTGALSVYEAIRNYENTYSMVTLIVAKLVK